MSVTLQYVASSGRIYDLKGDAIRTQKANYHRFDWTVESVELQFGERPIAFSRNAAIYETTLQLVGSYSKKKELLEALHDDFELDVRSMKTGRLVWGDYYIECYCTMSNTEPNDNDRWTDNTVRFYCPRPFWVKEEHHTFYPQAGGTGSDLDYPYDYAHDYFSGVAGNVIWATGFPFESDFKMIVYGPVSDPRVQVNGHPYEILDVLGADEYITIDSRDNTVKKTTSAGQTVNIFDLRNKAASVFQKMPAEALDISWSGGFGFDLTLYEERSEPRWST